MRTPSPSSPLFLFLIQLNTVLRSMLLSVTMHARLVHPPPAVMQALGYSAEAILCTHCCTGNMTKTFSRMATTSSTASLQLLHVDIRGPISVPGLAGFLDGPTLLLWLRSRTLRNSLKNSITASESFFSPLNLKVAAVISDKGGEFCNANFKSYFTGKGISHRL